MTVKKSLNQILNGKNKVFFDSSNDNDVDNDVDVDEEGEEDIPFPFQSSRLKSQKMNKRGVGRSDHCQEP